MRRTFVILGFAAVASGPLPGQQPAAIPSGSASAPASPAESLYVMAQRLVNEGKGVAGRAIVDSLFKVALPGSSAHADALFWRATLATTAAEAERDYRQLTVDYPLSPRAEDALLRLAQLELQRGERALALAHLDRLMREHASGPARARAAYWSARVHFEMNDAVRACRSLSDARSALPAGDIELRNQIEYAAQRCPTPVASAPVTQIPPGAASGTLLPTLPTADVSPDTSARVATSASVPPAAVTSSTTTTSSSTVSSPPARAVRPPETAAPTRSPGRVEPQRFSVQVAAYQTRPEAEQLVKKYRANGYDARAYGTVAPFRVRIGRFGTRAEAVELAKVLKQKSGAAFVVVAEAK